MYVYILTIQDQADFNRTIHHAVYESRKLAENAAEEVVTNRLNASDNNEGLGDTFSRDICSMLLREDETEEVEEPGYYLITWTQFDAFGAALAHSTQEYDSAETLPDAIAAFERDYGTVRPNKHGEVFVIKSITWLPSA